MVLSSASKISSMQSKDSTNLLDQSQLDLMILIRRMIIKEMILNYCLRRLMKRQFERTEITCINELLRTMIELCPEKEWLRNKILTEKVKYHHENISDNKFMDNRWFEHHKHKLDLNILLTQGEQLEEWVHSLMEQMHRRSIEWEMSLGEFWMAIKSLECQ